MNIKKYSVKKQRNLIKFIQLGDKTFVEEKGFDADTGDELPTNTVQIDLKQIIDRRDVLKVELGQLEMMIKDIVEIQKGDTKPQD